MIRISTANGKLNNDAVGIAGPGRRPVPTCQRPRHAYRGRYWHAREWTHTQWEELR